VNRTFNARYEFVRAFVAAILTYTPYFISTVNVDYEVD
jgi:hypothetical protein